MGTIRIIIQLLGGVAQERAGERAPDLREDGRGRTSRLSPWPQR